MTDFPKIQRAILSLKKMSELSQEVVKVVKGADEIQIRKIIDSYRLALSLFDEDAILLKQTLALDELSPMQRAELSMYFEINKVVDNLIEKKIGNNINVTQSADGPKNINFENFHALIDWQLPKVWNFNLDVVFLEKKSPPDLIRALKDRGQKRVLFHGHDFQDVQSDHNEVDENSAERALKRFTFPYPTRLCFFNDAFALGTDPDGYRLTSEKLIECFKHQTANNNTIANFKESWTENSLKNLPNVLTATSAGELKKQFEGQNVIVVSPGPSLKKNIHTLKNVQNAIIVCLAQSLPALREYEIQPDFVMVMDSQDFSFVVDDQQVKNSCLICFDYISPMFLNKKFKRVFITFSSNSPFHRYLFANSTIFDFEDVSSVAVGAVKIAKDLGARNIAIVGQDLSFTDEKYFGSFYEADRLSPMDMTLTEELPGYYGGKVRTTFHYFFYHLQLKNFAHNWKISGAHVKLYNCTEGGAFIEGFENIELKEISNIFGRNINLMEVEDISKSLKDELSDNADKFLMEIKRSLQVILKKLKRWKQKVRPNSMEIGVHFLETEIFELAVSTPILCDYLYNSLLKFSSTQSTGFNLEIQTFQKIQSLDEIEILSEIFYLRLNEVVCSIKPVN